MNTIPISSAKLNVVFKPGNLPRIDANDPRFEVSLDGCKIAVRINAKAARKLAEHQGGAILQGRLVVEGGRFVLDQAGFQFLEKRVEANT